MSQTHIGEYMRDFEGKTGVPLSIVHSPVLESHGDHSYTWVTLFEKVHVLVHKGDSLPAAFMGQLDPNLQVRPMYVFEEDYRVQDAYHSDKGITPLVPMKRQALDLLLAEHLIQMFVEIATKRIES